VRGTSCDVTRWACVTPERDRGRETERERQRKMKSITWRESYEEQTRKGFAVEREYGKTVKAR